MIDTLDPGGAERMAVNLANEFTQMNISNLLIPSRRLGILSDLVKDQQTLKVLGKKHTFDLGAFFSLVRTVKKIKPDVIHAHGTSLYWGWALKKLYPSLTLVWHDHLGISDDVLKNNPRKEVKWLGKGVDLVITANQPTQAYWRLQEIWIKEKVVYLPNFPSIELYPAKSPESFTFLHLANYRSEKGQKHLLQAARILLDQGLSFRLRLVGKAVDPIWKNEIAQLIEELSLKAVVSLEREVANVGKVLSEVNAGLVASDREGLPVALLEYGLAGLPVVSTRVGQCSEVLGYGDFGLLVEPQDPRELAQAMKTLIENPETAKVLGQSYQMHVNANYGAFGFVQTYLSLISL